MNLYLSRCLLFITFLGIPFQSYAFKIDTHVWIGQQVINDLSDDSKLRFKLGDQYVDIPVRTDIVASILSNQTEFLLGNIGPDAIPDVVVGQMAVHPGVQDDNYNIIGWRTNDWLNYILQESSMSSLSTALGYGYMGHAAADVFAHTYVNQYAGDVFILGDGETLVEQRHFKLESYIAEKMPPMKDISGLVIEKPWEILVPGDGFATFVRDKLIYNDTIQGEYYKNSYTTHLAAYYQFRKDMDELAESERWEKINQWFAKLILDVEFDYQASDEEAALIIGLAERIVEAINVDALDQAQDYANQLYSKVSKYESRGYSKLASAVSTMRDVETRWVNKLQEYRIKLAEIVDCKDQFCTTILGTEVCQPGYQLHPAYLQCTLNNQIINESLTTIENELLGLKNEYTDSLVEVRIQMIALADAIVAIHNALTDFWQQGHSDVSSPQSNLRAWRDDLDVAMVAYVKAATQAMVNTMKGNPADSVEPITTWFKCYHRRIIDFPTNVPGTVSGCEFKESLRQVKDAVTRIVGIMDIARIAGLTVPQDILDEMVRLRDVYIDEIVDGLKAVILDEIEAILPFEMEELLRLFNEETTDADLNYFFTKTPAQDFIPNAVDKHLILIPDMATRVKKEMALPVPTVELPDPALDPNTFPPVYNAVVMAKLAILDKVGFDQLAVFSGSNDHIAFNFMNVVAEAFGSIDGNHQWMEVPPPLPRDMPEQLVVSDTYSTDRSAFGEIGGLGFVPWKGDMRNKMFRKLFIGPLSSGIDAPEIINMSEIVRSEYPYNPCAIYPYPDSIHDNTCSALIMAPSGLVY